ncbi:hypothetical protein ACHAPJ_012512 [Fusarium lateritium]
MNPADSNRRRVENYRESCDNCAKSKVRCGKEQPWCQRCVRRNQICSYSPSQRSRKRTLSTTNTEGEQWTGTVPFLPMNGGSASAMSKDASALLGQADGWGPCPDLVELLASDCSTESVTPENMNLIWLSEMEAMAGDRNMNKGLERMDTLLFPQTSGIGASPSTDTGISSVASIDNMGPGLKRSTTNRQHCEADLMTTLRKLDLPSFSCRGEPKTSQNLGNVLTASRSALSCLSKTVLCTCAPSDNVALLVTAAILRILSWHDIVLQNCHGSRGNTTTTTSVEGGFDSPVESPDNDELDGMSTKDTDMPQEGGEGPGLFMPPMTIGAYELDSENRERMIGHILLSELSKMGRLLNNFSKKFCDPQSITLSNDNKSQLYLALEMFIRSKHSVTVLAVRKKMEAK